MSITLVTGASSGLGRGIAKRLAARGETIAAVSRRREPLDQLVREIGIAGGRAVAVTCDALDREEVRRVVDLVESTNGPIARLVSCVGGGKRTAIDDFRADQVAEMFALNVLTFANCLEAVLPRMLRRQHGHIVAISSLAATRGLPSAPEYSAAKAALSALLEGLRIDLKSRGIDVTLVSPGFVRGDENKKRRPMDISIDMAATRIVNAIEQRQKTCAFPLRLALILSVLRFVPPTMADAIISTMRSRTKFRPKSYKK